MLMCEPGEASRRYERDRPGSLIHVDVEKLGNIPDGGGHRFVGRQQGDRNRAATRNEPPNAHRQPKIGTALVHTVIDDNSRVAYAEVHDDETAATAVGVLLRAVSWFTARGVTVERVLSDNGRAFSRQYTSESARRNAPRAWLHVHNRHRPYSAIGTKPPISRLTNVLGQYN